MYRMLICLVAFVSTASVAETQQGVTRTSPRTSFTTHKTSEVFAQCVLDASRSEFPASSVESKKTSKVITVSRAPTDAAVAVIDVQQGTGGLGMVIIQTASRAQPERDPSVKIARNCQ